MTENAQVLTAIGLMSGTSLDGIDAVLAETDGDGVFRIIADAYVPYTPAFKERLAKAAQGDIPLSDVLRLEDELTRHHSEAINMLRAKDGRAVDVVGFHGQTIRHLPDEGLTWQLGNASRLAQETGLRVVSDFRRRDMAAGGQGAPLAPLFHEVMLRNQSKPAMILNLGGVGNITWINQQGEVRGTDTGPGCGLLDQFMLQRTGQPFDRDGALALQGRADMAWVADFIARNGFFKRPFPKAADRYDFQDADMQAYSDADGAATLTALTVEGVRLAAAAMPVWPQGVWVTGGGAKNPAIMAGLKQHFSRLGTVADLGYDADMVEAGCFAWLAVRRLKGMPTSDPKVTGATVATSGGVVTS